MAIDDYKNIFEDINQDIERADRKIWEIGQAEDRADIDKKVSGQEDRLDKLNIDDDGALMQDSAALAKTKDFWNTIASGIGIGDWGQIDVNLQGRKVNTLNKDFDSLSELDGDYSQENIAREMTNLKDEYEKAEEDPTAQHLVYTYRLYDGKDEDGKNKYLYKTGTAKVSAWDRTREDFEKKGAELVAEKKFAGAQDWEERFNTIAAMTSGLDAVDKGFKKSSNVSYGSGYTEIRTDDVLGVDRSNIDTYQMEKLSKEEKFKWDKEGEGLDDGYEDAFTSGVVRLGSDIGDLAVTLGSFGILSDNFFDDLSKNADKIAGYDRRGATAAITESVNAFHRGDYFQAVFSNIGSKTEMLAESLPEMIVMMGSGGGAGALKATSKAKNLIKLKNKASSLKNAGKDASHLNNSIRKIRKDLAVDNDKILALADISMASAAVKSVSSMYGFNAIVAKNTNNIIEERIENGDSDITIGEVAAIGASQFILTGLDKISFDSIVKSKELIDAFGKAYRVAGSSGKEFAKKKAAQILSTVATEGIQEGAQEYTQTWGEILGANVGVDGKGSLDDILSDKKLQDDALGSALAGMASGGALSGVTTSTKAAMDAGSSFTSKSSHRDTILEPDQMIQPDIPFRDKIRALRDHVDVGSEYSISGASPLDIVKSMKESGLSDGDSLGIQRALVKSLIQNVEKHQNSESFDMLKEAMTDGTIDEKSKERTIMKLAIDMIDEMSNVYKKETRGSGSDDGIKGTRIQGILDADEDTQDVAIDGNPVKGKLDGIVLKYSKKVELLSKSGMDTSKASDALKTLIKYNTSDSYNFDAKSGTDVSSEISSIGFMFSDGEIGKPSISAYASRLPDIADGSYEGKSGFITESGFHNWAKSRENRASKNKIYGKSVAKYANENKEMLSIVNEILASDSVSESTKNNYITTKQRLENGIVFAAKNMINLKNRPSGKISDQDLENIIYEIKNGDVESKRKIPTDLTYDQSMMVIKSSIKSKPKNRNEIVDGLYAAKNKDDIVEAMGMLTDKKDIAYANHVLKTTDKEPVENIESIYDEMKNLGDLEEKKTLFNQVVAGSRLTNDEYSSLVDLLAGSETKKDINIAEQIAKASTISDMSRVGSTIAGMKDSLSDEEITDLRKQYAQKTKEIKSKREPVTKVQDKVKDDTSAIDMAIQNIDYLIDKVSNTDDPSLTGSDLIVVNNIKKRINYEANKAKDELKSLEEQKSKREANINRAESSLAKMASKIVEKLKAKLAPLLSRLKKVKHSSEVLSGMVKALDLYLDNESTVNERDNIVNIANKAKELLGKDKESIKKDIDKLDTKEKKKKITAELVSDKPETSATRSSIKNKIVSIVYDAGSKFAEFSKRNANIREKIDTELEKLSKSSEISGKINERYNRLNDKLTKIHDELESLSGFISRAIRRDPSDNNIIIAQNKLEDTLKERDSIILSMDEIINKNFDGDRMQKYTSLHNKLSKDMDYYIGELRGELSKLVKKKLGLSKEKDARGELSKVASNIESSANKPSADEIKSKIESASPSGKPKYSYAGQTVLDKITGRISELLEVNKFSALSKIPLMISRSNEYSVNEDLLELSDTDTVSATKVAKEAIDKISLIDATTYNGKNSSTAIDENGKLINTLNKGLFNFFELTHLEDEKIKLDGQIEEAIKFGVVAYDVLAGSVLSNLNSMNDVELARKANISPEDVKAYRKQLYSGNVPAILLRKEILPLVKDMIGIKVKKDSDTSLDEALSTSIEAMVEAQVKSNDLGEFGKLELGNKSLIMYKSKSNRDSIKPISDAVRTISYMSESTERTRPQKDREKIVTDKTIMNSHVELSDDQTKRINDQQDTSWTFDSSMNDILKSYEKEKQDVYDLFGFKAISDDMHISEKKLQVALNDKIVRETDILIDHYKNIGDDEFYIKWGITKSERFTVKSDLNVQESKIHRILMSTNGYKSNIDPLAEIREVIDIDETNMSNEEAFEVAIAQGLDLDPDKGSKFKVFNSVRNIVNIYGDKVSFVDEKYEAAQKFIDSENFSIQYLNEASINLDEREHGLKVLIELRNLNQHKKSKTSKPYESRLFMESDAITSGPILNFGQVFTSHSLKMMEKGGLYTKLSRDKWEKYTKRLLSEKHGVSEDDILFTAGSLIEAGEYHASMVSDGEIKPKPVEIDGEDVDVFMDIYTAVGSDVVTNLLDIDKDNYTEIEKIAIDKFKEKANSLKGGRKISKPVIIPNVYGSSLKKSLASLASDTLVKDIVDDLKLGSSKILRLLIGSKVRKNSEEESNNEYKSRVNAAIKKEMNNINNYTVYVDGSFRRPTKEEFSVGTLSSQEAKAKAFDLDEIDASELAYKAQKRTIGGLFKDAMHIMFGEIESVRKSTKAVDVIVSEIFNIKMKDAVNEFRLKNNGIISKEDVIDIIRKIEADGFGHMIEFSDRVQPLLKKSSSSNVSARSYIKLGNGQESSSTFSNTEYIDNSGASVTIPIHAIDSSIIMKALEDNDFTSIYDAAIMGANGGSISEFTNEYSKATMVDTLKYRNFKSYTDKMKTMVDRLSDQEREKLFDNVFSQVKSKYSDTAESTVNMENESFFAFKNIDSVYTNVVGSGITSNGYIVNGLKTDISKKVQISVNEESANIDYVDSFGNIVKTIKSIKSDTGGYNVEIYQAQKINGQGVFKYSNSVSDAENALDAISKTNKKIEDDVFGQSTFKNNQSGTKLFLDRNRKSNSIESVLSSDSRAIEQNETFSRLGISPVYIMELIEESVDIINDGVNNINNTTEMYSNHSHILGAVPINVDISKIKSEPVNKEGILESLYDYQEKAWVQAKKHIMDISGMSIEDAASSGDFDKEFMLLGLDGYLFDSGKDKDIESLTQEQFDKIDEYVNDKNKGC